MSRFSKHNVDKKRSMDLGAPSTISSVAENQIITNDKINREILNKNPMCTGNEEIPSFLNDRLLVGWDGPDDKDNPRNWPCWKKIVTTVILCLCTASQYMGGAIVSTDQHEIQHFFGTTRTKAALDITLFVWGYGIGDLWFTPMSEMPLFRGRNPTYLACQLIYAILQIPTALANNLTGFVILRFLGGVFASPPLSTTAASINDIWAMPHQTFALVLWAFGQTTGPYIGPLIGAALTLTHDWRYIFWCLLAVSGGMLIVMVFFLPETSEQELLMRKAKRLREDTGDPRWIAPGEILLHTQTPKAVLKEMFFKPIKMTLMDPVLFLIDLHVGLVYSSMYLYLEALPLVYEGLYGFNKVQLGLGFQPCVIGNFVGAAIYLLYVWNKREGISDSPEKVFGPSAAFGALMFPVGMLMWGWLSADGIHWVAGMFGNLLYGIGDIFVFQSYFAFMGSMYPPHMAGSAFASNNIVRALMAGAWPLFGEVVYTHTSINKFPVGWGCTILAAIGFAILPFPIYLTLKGKNLREYAARKYARE